MIGSNYNSSTIYSHIHIYTSVLYHSKLMYHQNLNTSSAVFWYQFAMEVNSWTCLLMQKWWNKTLNKNILRIVHVNCAVDPLTQDSRAVKSLVLFFTNHGSQNGQGIIFHQPRFPSNSRGFLYYSQPFGGNRSCFGHDEIWSENMRHIETSKLDEPTQPSSSFWGDNLPKNKKNVP